MNLVRANVFLFAAAVVLAVPTCLQIRADGDAFTDIARIPLLFDGFTSDNVGLVVIGQPKKEQPPADPQNPDAKRQLQYDQLVFQRTDKGFAIAAMAGERAGVPINKDRVENDVFVHLRAIRADRETMVQPNATPQQLEQYGLDDAHATVIRASDATGQRNFAELLVGKDANSGTSGTDVVRGKYVRKLDSSDVILYEIDRPWQLDVAEERWIDRVVARIEADKVKKLSIKNTATAGAVFTFERADGKAQWQAKDAPADVGAVRQSEVESLVQRLRMVTVQEFRQPMPRVPNPAQLGLQPPQIELSVTVRDGDHERVVTFAIGNKVDGKNDYYLQVSDVPFLMTLAQPFVTPFELDVKQMFDPKSAPVPANEGPK